MIVNIGLHNHPESDTIKNVVGIKVQKVIVPKKQSAQHVKNAADNIY